MKGSILHLYSNLASFYNRVADRPLLAKSISNVGTVRGYNTLEVKPVGITKNCTLKSLPITLNPLSNSRSMVNKSTPLPTSLNP